jgi:hypothetical protein
MPYKKSTKKTWRLIFVLWTTLKFEGYLLISIHARVVVLVSLSVSRLLSTQGSGPITNQVLLSGVHDKLLPLISTK